MASFDQDFLSYIHAQNEKENYVVSPLSFRAALILAVEGADASTHAQLLSAMGFASEEEMTQWYAAVRESVDYFDGWVRRQEQIAKEEAQFYPPGEAPEVPVHAYRVLNSVWSNTDRFGEFLPGYIPKLDTESSFGRETLIQYLMDRGAVDAFDANTADFSRMADYPWYISDILQKAKIKTDEEGLEAAAVTMVMMAEGAFLEPEKPQYREFHANEPFRYYIVTTQTQTPLVVFAGQEVR